MQEVAGRRLESSIAALQRSLQAGVDDTKVYERGSMRASDVNVLLVELSGRAVQAAADRADPAVSIPAQRRRN